MSTFCCVIATVGNYKVIGINALAIAVYAWFLYKTYYLSYQTGILAVQFLKKQCPFRFRIDYIL